MTSTLVRIRPRHAARDRAGGWCRRAAALGLVVGAFGLAGCSSTPSDSVATDEATSADELADADGPCPVELPTGDDPSGHGFGVEEPASQAPSFEEPEEAWVCEYQFFDKATTEQGGAVLAWRFEGEPEPVASADLPALHGALADLAPIDGNQMCTEELGPRWMVVLSSGGDLTGAVVDGYGCRNVRLTDNPHTTAPGAADQDGVVSGVLTGGAAVLDVLGLSSEN